MTREKISEYDAVASNNTDVNGVNIAENCPPSGMNNMGREIMAALKRFQTGSDGDGVTVGGNLVVSGSSTLATTAISSADINGGTIDGTTIGGASAAAGAFTTLSATGVTTVQAGTNSAPAITTTGDTNTGIFFPAADQVAVATNGVERVNLGNSATVFNDGGADVDFRVEGDTEANLLFVDAGNDRVGVKTATPAVALDVVGQVRASTGILFGSDTAAANTLDDYEEGTWTPAYSTSGGSFAYDAATQGQYTKIGNVVTLYFRIYTTSATVGTGDVSITGLPFAENITSGTGGGSIGDRRLFGGDTPDTLTVLGSSIFPFYRTSVNGANTRLQASDLGTAGGSQNLMDGQITYITS
jgi:hypothetical protein